MKRVFPLALGLALVAATAAAHGFWTDRWTTAELSERAARLETIPDQIGNWVGEPFEGGKGQREPLAGRRHRRYTHQRTGTSVLVVQVCGRPGPASIHTPDVCFAGGGFDVGAPIRYEVPLSGGAPRAEFWVSHMVRTKAAEQTHLRIYWAWSADGSWQAAESPRLAFARHALLHKLYVIREMAGPNDHPLDGDPCREFLQQYVPELRRTVFAN